MKKKDSLSDFVSKAILVHGNKYNYSKVEYISSKTKVCIICPIHGDFWQTPNNHLNGCGCTICRTKRPQKVFNIGIFDFKDQIHRGTIEHKCYTIWNSLIRRCYSTVFNTNKSTYQDCSVCDEWLYFSNFKEWFDDPNNGYKDGYQLDKDILVKGNKIYSPETCCFVPREINVLFTKRQNDRGIYPIGVSKKDKYFYSQLNKKKERVFLGNFNNPFAAFSAYKIAKEQYVKELADKYFKEGLITQRVYESLMKYKVEITD